MSIDSEHKDFIWQQSESGLLLSPSAVERVAYLSSLEPEKTQHLRVAITGGGCSGFQYVFSFDTEIRADDIVTQVTYTLKNDEEKNFACLVDPLSFTYLMGATIDYKKSLQGSHFTVQNPNAQSTCGCGSSFSIGGP